MEENTKFHGIGIEYEFNFANIQHIKESSLLTYYCLEKKNIAKLYEDGHYKILCYFDESLLEKSKLLLKEYTMLLITLLKKYDDDIKNISNNINVLDEIINNCATLIYTLFSNYKERYINNSIESSKLIFIFCSYIYEIIKRYYGDEITLNDALGILEKITVIKHENNDMEINKFYDKIGFTNGLKVVLSKKSLYNVFRSLFVYDNISDDTSILGIFTYGGYLRDFNTNNNTIVEADMNRIEIKTDKPYIKINDAVDDIFNTKKIIGKTENIYIGSLYDNHYTYYEDDNKNVIGSNLINNTVQFNITLPFKKESDMNMVKQNHIQLIKFIILIQPLLFSTFMCGSDYIIDVTKNKKPLLIPFYFTHYRGSYSLDNVNDFYVNYIVNSYRDKDNDAYEYYELDKPLMGKSIYNNILNKKNKFVDLLNENHYITDIPNYELYGSDFRINAELYDPKSLSSFFGFEYRLFSDMTPLAMKQFLRLLFLFAEYMNQNNIHVKENPKELLSNELLDFFAEIHIKGWLSRVPESYVRLLNNTYKFNIEYKVMTNYDLLNLIYISLHNNITKDNFNNTHFIKYIDDASEYSTPLNSSFKLENLNRKYITNSITRYFITNNSLLDNLKLIFSNLNKKNVTYEIIRESIKHIVNPQFTADVYYWAIDNGLLNIDIYLSRYLKYKRKYKSKKRSINLHY